MNAFQRLKKNAKLGRGIRLSADETKEVHTEISINRALLAPDPDLVLCPKCEKWVEPWKGDYYACPTCLPQALGRLGPPNPRVWELRARRPDLFISPPHSPFELVEEDSVSVPAHYTFDITAAKHAAGKLLLEIDRPLTGEEEEKMNLELVSP